ncbi:hypothetical protein [Streptomyces sp. NPDC007856]|uniref:hypothetical protein n=1 Tax=Streptomyces sp. NPDC007856 TaxID=3364781 RepID=UPI003676E1F7
MIEHPAHYRRHRFFMMAITGAVVATTLSGCAGGEFSKADKSACEKFIATYRSYETDRTSVTKEGLNQAAAALVNTSDKGVSKAAASWRDVTFPESSIDRYAKPLVDACVRAGASAAPSPAGTGQ